MNQRPKVNSVMLVADLVSVNGALGGDQEGGG